MHIYKQDLPSIKYYKKLQEALHIQKRKIGIFIEDNSFESNWPLYGGEAYLIVNRNVNVI